MRKNEQVFAWIDNRLAKYLKSEADNFKQSNGIRTGTAGMSRVLYDKVIVPNGIKLHIQDIKINKRLKNL